MRHRVSVEIDAVPAVVWATVVAVERWPEWTPTMRSVRRLDTGDLRVGSEARISQPRMPPVRWRVTALEPGTSFTWGTRGSGLRMAAGHHVTEREGGGTRVTLDLDLDGPVTTVLGPLVDGTARRFVDIEARSLKSWCERHASA